MDKEGGCDENLEADTCASNNRHVTFAPRIRFLNSGHGSGFRPDSETNQELKSLDSSDTESLSLSNFSSDDFIEFNTQILLKSCGENSISQPTLSTKPSHAKEQCIVTSEASCRLEESINDYPKFSDVIHESARDYMLPTLSPSIQTMERPEDFDHHGIGASRSNRRSTSLKESASDGSVFRIHITNKREDALRTDVDLYKLEEQPKGAIDEDVKSRKRGMVDEPRNYASKSPLNNLLDTDVGDSMDSYNAVCQSDKFETSIPPLTSPEKKKSPRSLCHCPDLCSACHCFKWPCHCYCKWIGWPGCTINYCKCPIWSSCCVKHNY